MKLGIDWHNEKICIINNFSSRDASQPSNAKFMAVPRDSARICGCKIRTPHTKDGFGSNGRFFSGVRAKKNFHPFRWERSILVVKDK